MTEINLMCNGCGREMLDTPDNRTRDLCIWCTTFGDGVKVRAYDAYVKEHGAPPARIAPEKPWASTPEIVRETVAPERIRSRKVAQGVAPERTTPVPPTTTTRKWYEKREVGGRSVGKTQMLREAVREEEKRGKQVTYFKPLEIEGGDEKENEALRKEALEDLKKIEDKKKVKK